jgi:hypothetical protein
MKTFDLKLGWKKRRRRARLHLYNSKMRRFGMESRVAQDWFSGGRTRFQLGHGVRKMTRWHVDPSHQRNREEGRVPTTTLTGPATLGSAHWTAAKRGREPAHGILEGPAQGREGCGALSHGLRWKWEGTSLLAVARPSGQNQRGESYPFLFYFLNSPKQIFKCIWIGFEFLLKPPSSNK